MGDQKNNTPTLSLKATYDLIYEAKKLVSKINKGANEYPEEFSQQARARIEAEKLKARKQLEQRRDQVPWSGGHLPRPADDENLRKFILQVFLVFAREACKVGSQGLWTVERIRLEAEEYLRKFIIKAYSDEGYDKQGRKLEEMTDYYGSIQEEVWWAFKESAEYHQFEQELLAVAEQQARGSPQASGKAEATAVHKYARFWKKGFEGLHPSQMRKTEKYLVKAGLTIAERDCYYLKIGYGKTFAEIASRMGYKHHSTAQEHFEKARAKVEERNS